jgi:uncharacterized membrane protein
MNHGYKLGRNPNPAPYAVVGGALIVATIVAMAPAPRPVVSSSQPGAQAVAAGPAGYAQVQTVLAQRCYLCHGEQVQMKNIRLDQPDLLKTHAQAVYQQVVVTRQMPMNNATAITDAQRQLVQRWFENGAPVQ